MICSLIMFLSVFSLNCLKTQGLNTQYRNTDGGKVRQKCTELPQLTNSRYNGNNSIPKRILVTKPPNFCPPMYLIMLEYFIGNVLAMVTKAIWFI